MSSKIFTDGSELHEACLRFHLHQDDASALRIFNRRQSEFQSQVQVQDRDHLAAEANCAFHIGPCLGHGCNILETHNFADFQRSDAEFLAAQVEHEVLARSLIGFGG